MTLARSVSVGAVVLVDAGEIVGLMDTDGVPVAVGVAEGIPVAVAVDMGSSVLVRLGTFVGVHV